MRFIPTLSLLLASCAPAPTCPAICEAIIDECGLGDDYDGCVAGCRDLPWAENNRNDVKNCVSVSNCGEIARGQCLGVADQLGCNYRELWVLVSDCLPGPVNFTQTRECSFEPSEADWGSLPGPPTVHMEAYHGVRNIQAPWLEFGDECALQMWHIGGDASCTFQGQECLLAIRPLL